MIVAGGRAAETQPADRDGLARTDMPIHEGPAGEAGQHDGAAVDIQDSVQTARTADRRCLRAVIDLVRGDQTTDRQWRLRDRSVQDRIGEGIIACRSARQTQAGDRHRLGDADMTIGEGAGRRTGQCHLACINREHVGEVGEARQQVAHRPVIDLVVRRQSANRQSEWRDVGLNGRQRQRVVRRFRSAQAHAGNRDSFRNTDMAIAEGSHSRARQAHRARIRRQDALQRAGSADRIDGRAVIDSADAVEARDREGPRRDRP